MEQRRWWVTPKQQEKRNERALKQAHDSIRAGTYVEQTQTALPLDLNQRTNGDLPISPDAQRFQTPTRPPDYTPAPPQVPEDPNEYFRPTHKHCQPTVATLYRRAHQLFLRTRHTSDIDLPDTLSPEEQDYLENNPFRED